MYRFVLFALCVTAGVAAVHAPANAQMRDFEQSMGRLQNKLPQTTFDGTTLNVSTYDELQKVQTFLANYQKNAKIALDAWNRLGRGQNEERRKKLNANIQYHDALLAAFNEKSKTIKAPAAPEPVQVRTIAVDDAFIGPDIKKNAPVIIDTIGERSSHVQVWGHPGSKAKPSRYSIKLEFLVRHDDIAKDDVVMIQPTKGAKKLGAATPCSPKQVWPEPKLALFECETPKSRSDYKKLYNTAGDITLKLTYRKVIEGKEYKNFASFIVRAVKLKHGSANNPSLSWGMDRDIEMGASTLTESATGTQSGWGYELNDAMNAALYKGEPHALIHTMFKHDGKYRRTRMVCMYNGKRIAEADGNKDGSYYTWSYKKKGDTNRVNNTWEKHAYRLYQLHPRPFADGTKGTYSTPQHYMNENPGKYRCVITAEGEIVKEFHFEVGKDGEIKKPACQLKSMNTLHTTTLLPTKAIKPSTIKWDKRIAAKHGYAGRVKWAPGCPPKK